MQQGFNCRNRDFDLTVLIISIDLYLQFRKTTLSKMFKNMFFLIMTVAIINFAIGKKTVYESDSK